MGYQDQDMPASHRRNNQMRAIRMLAAKTEWLSGNLRWQDGRVYWIYFRGMLAPGPADLSQAQRTLNLIARHPAAAERVLGNSKVWLEQRRRRLELAKQLSGMDNSLLTELVQEALRRHPVVAQRLAPLLIAEALCINSLQPSPSAALVTAGESAETPLLALMEDEAAPLPGRALAALSLGAIHYKNRKPAAHSSDESTCHHSAHLFTQLLDGRALPSVDWLRRAYTWGLTRGLPEEPAFFLALLASEDGLRLAAEYVSAIETRHPFCLSSELMRDLLYQRVPADQVVALAAGAAAAGPLAARIRQRSKLPSKDKLFDRQQAARQTGQEREDALSRLSLLFEKYVRSTRDPVVIELAVYFSSLMLSVGSPVLALLGAVSQNLEAGLELPADLQRAYLEILCKRLDAVKSSVPTGKKEDREPQRVRAWLGQQWDRQAKLAHQLLKNTRSAQIAYDIIELGLADRAANTRWPDPEMYHWLLGVVHRLEMVRFGWSASSLLNAVDSLSNAREARATLGPIIEALMEAPEGLRGYILSELLDQLPTGRRAFRSALARALCYIPSLIRCAAQVAHTSRLWRFAGVVMAVGNGLTEETHQQSAMESLPQGTTLHADPEVRQRQLQLWVDWTVTFLLELEAETGHPRKDESLEMEARLALSLAEGDLDRFKILFRTAASYVFPGDDDQLDAGIKALDRFPMLRGPLSQIFPQQPGRCTDLLVRLGLASRLGEECLTPLMELHTPLHSHSTLTLPQPPAQSPSSNAVDLPGWSGLLEVAPGLEGMASSYLRAQELLGESQELPTGVRRALEQPRKWEEELGYLERRLESQPRADLTIRAANLRARLGNQEGLQGEIRQEVTERLAQAAAEAQMKAVEQQVTACYRTRLETMIGPVPADLEFNKNLVNATLLTVDVIKNRRLLLRMLRAYLSGERRWAEQHPANIAFLEQLAARGVDITSWLASHPRRYRCANIEGGWIHLHLERDPLHILQMGNYFDTCLSVGGCNSFSTVANACELNKRVVYASDGSGKVVGRKLIGINQEGQLIGFRTYTSLRDQERNETLRVIFRHYLGDFAAHCHLELGDRGTVPTLFAKDWYDDGAVEWGKNEGQIGKGSNG